MKWQLVLVLLLVPCVLATSLGNVPELQDRDLVIHPGLHREYSFPVGGANLIDVAVSVPPELKEYITLIDPAPHSGPRTVQVIMDFPAGADVAPGIYGVSLSANEVPEANSMVSTAVSVSAGFILRSYSADPLLEITGASFTPVPEGERANFSIGIISRTTTTLPEEIAHVSVLDENGSILASTNAIHGPLTIGESATIAGTIDTRKLVGGIYPTHVTVSYGGKEADDDKAILRVGTLTVDLADDYTKTFYYNQTNKFQFTLMSKWNRPLANVLATVNLDNQAKRTPPTTIPAFGQSERLEAYFDRTDTLPGPLNGTLTVTYQELNEDPALQEKMQVHTFSIPIHVDIIIPPVPAKVKTPWRPTLVQGIIVGNIVVLVFIIWLLFMLLRKKNEKEVQ